MLCAMRSPLRTIAFTFLTLASSAALAQEATPPPAGAPGSYATPPADPGAQPAPAQPGSPAQPQAQPAPQPYPPGPPPGGQPPPQPAPYAQPAPQPYAQPAPPPQQQVPPPPPAQRYEGQVGGYQEPTYPEPTGDGGGGSGPSWSPTGFSARIDPLNWLLAGRLGIALELGVLDWLSVEMIPVFVANEEPPSFNLSGRDDTVYQESDGLGPIAGTSIGVGFWLAKLFHSYVLRLVYQNYSYSYVAEDENGIFDQVNHTDRRLIFVLGSFSRFSAFTIGGGLELGYELNQRERCDLVRSGGRFQASDSSCDGEMRIAIEDRTVPETGNLHDFLYPAYLGFRFSLGVSFD